VDLGGEAVALTARQAALFDALRPGLDREALAALCAEHGCVSSPPGANWKSLFAAPRGKRILEIGPGFGDDTVELARTGSVACLVRHAAAAAALRHRLAVAGAGEVSVALIDRLDRLPLADASVGGVALETAAAAAFGLGPSGLDRLAAELARVVVPGGVVYVGVRSPLDRWLAPLRSALQAKTRARSLGALIKSDPSASERGLRPGAWIRAMRGHGFDAPLDYAPLPDDRDPQVIIPVDEPAVVSYFLDNLIRKNSVAVRIAIRLAHFSVTVNLFRNLVPYRYLFFERLEDSGAVGAAR
jgi:SAM-dependent methyltransferase